MWDIAVYTADETLLRVSSARYPPLKIEPATKECRAETQPLIQWFTGSISSVGHRGIHCWWDLIKSLISTISPTEDRTSDQRMQSRNSTTDPMVYWFDIECGTSRYTLLMRLNKVETTVDCFCMSHAVLVGFSYHLCIYETIWLWMTIYIYIYIVCYIFK